MNTYEIVSIINIAREEEEDLSAAEETISQEIIKAGGEVMDIGSMGRRKLAYAIEDYTEGLYILAHFMLPPEAIVALRNSLKLNNSIIRSLIVRYKKRPTIELETVDPEESGPELPEAVIETVIMDVPIVDDTDDDISITTSEETESFDDLQLEVNIDSIPDEDIPGTGPKEV